MTKKSGIYGHWCETCNRWYIGQCAREVHKRWKEHRDDVENRNEDNAIVRHFMDHPKHVYNDQNFKLIKNVPQDRYLNAWESFYINKFKDKKMNIKPPPLESDLFKYFV